MKLKKTLLKLAGIFAGGGAVAATVPAVGDCLPGVQEVSMTQLFVAGSTILMGIAGLFSKRPQDH